MGDPERKLFMGGGKASRGRIRSAMSSNLEIKRHQGYEISALVWAIK